MLGLVFRGGEGPHARDFNGDEGRGSKSYRVWLMGREGRGGEGKEGEISLFLFGS